MKGKKKNNAFTVEHHVLLLGWISREMIHRFGEEKGEKVLLDAIERYARQRGKRMAMRVAADNRELTALNYLCYGEWTSEKGSLVTKIIDRTPNLKVHVSHCPWESIWKEQGMLEYGKYYCMVADKAIYEGFNPDLKLDVNGTRTNGFPQCEFIFRDLTANLGKLLVLLIRKKWVAKKAVMPWDYHTGHVFKTLGETITSAFGKEGEEVMVKVLEEFKNYFGDEAAAILDQYRETDFDALPV